MAHLKVIVFAFLLTTTLLAASRPIQGTCDAKVEGWFGSYYFSDCSPTNCSAGCSIFESELGSGVTKLFCECSDSDPVGPTCCDVVIIEMTGFNYPAIEGGCQNEDPICPPGHCTEIFKSGDPEFWDAECKEPG